MTLDEHLGDLLADAATAADAAPPTRTGVQSAIGRRQARRRRQRLAASGLAALCLVAGVAGGLALTSDDSEDSGPIVEPNELPEVPGVGLEVSGLIQRSFDLGPPEDIGEPPVTIAIFRPDDELTSALFSVVIEPPSDDQVPESDRGDPLDLDGDGVSDARIAEVSNTFAVTWPLDDGSIAGLAGIGVPQRVLHDYAATLYGPTLDLAALPAPEGFPLRSTLTDPSPLPVTESTVTYENDGGGHLTVVATNQPGAADLAIASSDYFGGDFVGGPVDSDLLGPGQMIYKKPGPGQLYVIIRTDAGLTVEISGSDVNVGFVLNAINQGDFVSVEPPAPPASTTTGVPVDTIIRDTTVPTSTPAPPNTSITGIRVGAHSTFDRVVIEFAEAVPTTHSVSPANLPGAGECEPPALAGDAFLNVHLGLMDPAEPLTVQGTADGPVQQVVVACSFEAFVDLTIQINTERSAGELWNEAAVQVLDDPARLVIDLPR